MSIKISVIVPVYNIEKYIAECIESIINQTYKNLQIVLVDDGSLDKSGEICDEYARKDTRITVIHQENKGLVAARKAGLNISDGEFIGFVDGDDYIEPDMYENLLNAIQNSHADMVHTGYFENQIEVIPFVDANIDLNEDRDVFVKRVIRSEGITSSIWSKLFRSELIKKCYFMVDDDASYGEDLICLCAVALNANKVCLCADAFYHYRIREDSISHCKGVYRVKKEVTLYNCLCDLLKKEDCLNLYDKDMDLFLLQHIIFAIEQSTEDEFVIPRYEFSNVEELQGKKIIVYGAGCVGKDYYSQLCRCTDCEVVAWVDSYPEKYSYKYIKVFGKDYLLEKSYDAILIAVKKETVYLEIKKKLLEMGIAEEKIVWELPHKRF